MKSMRRPLPSSSAKLTTSRRARLACGQAAWKTASADGASWACVTSAARHDLAEGRAQPGTRRQQKQQAQRGHRGNTQDVRMDRLPVQRRKHHAQAQRQRKQQRDHPAFLDRADLPRQRERHQQHPADAKQAGEEAAGRRAPVEAQAAAPQRAPAPAHHRPGQHRQRHEGGERFQHTHASLPHPPQPGRVRGAVLHLAQGAAEVQRGMPGHPGGVRQDQQAGQEHAIVVLGLQPEPAQHPKADMARQRRPPQQGEIEPQGGAGEGGHQDRMGLDAQRFPTELGKQRQRGGHGQGAAAAGCRSRAAAAG